MAKKTEKPKELNEYAVEAEEIVASIDAEQAEPPKTQTGYAHYEEPECPTQ